MDGPIKQLCECIGRSEKLFSAFADYCANKVKEESAPSWGIIIRNVLTSIQETGEKVRLLFDCIMGNRNCYQKNPSAMSCKMTTDAHEIPYNRILISCTHIKYFKLTYFCTS